MNTLEEAMQVTSRERNHDYGNPIDNHRRTMKFWQSYLEEIVFRRTGFRVEIPMVEEDVCWMNVLQKIAREINLPKRDSIVDTEGWARNVEMIQEDRMANQKAVFNGVEIVPVNITQFIPERVSPEDAEYTDV